VWEAYFDDAAWGLWGPTPWTSGSWDDPNQEWDNVGNGLLLTEIGAWAVGYRPAKIKVTFNGIATADIELQDTTTGVIASKLAANSGDEIDITFAGNDIDNLFIAEGDANNFSVTNIQFYVFN